MEHLQEKADFLRRQYTGKLRDMGPQATRRWGKMNMQQMVEHMTYSMRIANGRDLYTEAVNSPEITQKMQAFLASEKQFRENTVNSMLPEEPVPVRHRSFEDAVSELQDEIDHFFLVFEGQPGKTILNPLFGALDQDQWVQLLHKHAWHHLRQFGVE